MPICSHFSPWPILGVAVMTALVTLPAGVYSQSGGTPGVEVNRNVIEALPGPRPLSGPATAGSRTDKPPARPQSQFYGDPLYPIRPGSAAPSRRSASPLPPAPVAATTLRIPAATRKPPVPDPLPAARDTTAAPATGTATVSEPVAAPPPATPKPSAPPARQAAATPPQPPAPATARPGTPPPPPVLSPSPAPVGVDRAAPMPAETGDVETARLEPGEPAAPATLTAGDLTVLAFDRDETVLKDDARAELDRVASALEASPDLRVQVEAFASGPSLSASQARRLSLSRALAVRSHLLDREIESARIDVRALGDRAPAEPKNRVDIRMIER